MLFAVVFLLVLPAISGRQLRVIRVDNSELKDRAHKNEVAQCFVTSLIVSCGVTSTCVQPKSSCTCRSKTTSLRPSSLLPTLSTSSDGKSSTSAASVPTGGGSTQMQSSSLVMSTTTTDQTTRTESPMSTEETMIMTTKPLEPTDEPTTESPTPTDSEMSTGSPVSTDEPTPTEPTPTEPTPTEPTPTEPTPTEPTPTEPTPTEPTPTEPTLTEPTSTEQPTSGRSNTPTDSSTPMPSPVTPTTSPSSPSTETPTPTTEIPSTTSSSKPPCPTCLAVPGKNKCDVTTSCIRLGGAFRCACRAGYKSGETNKDYRIEDANFNFLVFVPEGTSCNTLCAQRIGSPSGLCSEVEIAAEQCQL